MKIDKPITTLFMLSSLDGKITTGDTDEMDYDKDFPHIPGLSEGLHQYYELEKKTDLYSLNTGRVIAKIGVNEKTIEPTRIDVSFVILDNKPHLTEQGVLYLSKWVKKMYLVTTNKKHPAYKLSNKINNIEIISYDEKVDLVDLLKILKSKHNVDRLTIQSGGTMNASWVREGLVDYISLVVAPCLIGGKDTQSLISGESIHSASELGKIKVLKLEKFEVLENSYIHVFYKVLNEI